MTEKHQYCPVGHREYIGRVVVQTAQGTAVGGLIQHPICPCSAESMPPHEIVEAWNYTVLCSSDNRDGPAVIPVGS